MISIPVVLLVDSLVCLGFGLVWGVVLGARCQKWVIRSRILRDVRAGRLWFAPIPPPEDHPAAEVLRDE